MPSIRTACLAALLLAASARAGELPVWFGTYTGAATKSEGIYVARFDTERGTLTPPVLAGAARNPSFLALHPRLPVLYAVAEVGGRDTPHGAVTAFAIDAVTGKLAELGSESTGGAGPCHVAVDADGLVVLAANYGGGSVACFGLTAEGRLEPCVSGTGAAGFLQHAAPATAAAGSDPKRQGKPHAHAVDVAPGGRAVFVCDLGLDRVFVHALDRERATFAPWTAAATQPGAGPRQFAIHPDGRRAWCVNELDLTVTALRITPDGYLSAGATCSTLPSGVSDRRGFSAAEIAVHPDGRFLYASNRGHDSIAMFRIVDDAGGLELLGTEPTRGKTPRHFAIAPGGRFLLVGGQGSNAVTVFAIDRETGRLSFTGTSVDVPSPVCIAYGREPDSSRSSR
jgi:6-phosphogluconolactonase